MEIGGERDILSVKLKALQHNFNEEKSKSDKGFKTIKLIKKDLKLAKAARKSADNSTCLQSDSFEINTGKPQGVNINSGGSSLKKCKVSIIKHERKN